MRVCLLPLFILDTRQLQQITHLKQHLSLLQEKKKQMEDGYIKELSFLKQQLGITDAEPSLAGKRPHEHVNLPGTNGDVPVLKRPKADSVFLKLHEFSHSCVVCCVRFNHDASYLAVATNVVEVYDVMRGSLYKRFPHTGRNIRAVAFSADGQYLVTGSEDSVIRLWDLETGELVANFEGHCFDIYSIDFTSDGKYIVSGSGDNTVRIWDIEQKILVHKMGEEISAEEDTSEGVTSIAVASNNAFVAAGTLSKNILIYSMDGKCLRTLEGHVNAIYSVAISPDCRYVASGALDNTIRIWDVEDGRQLRVLNGHDNFVLSLSFTSDSKYLISGSKDKCIILWNVETGTVVDKIMEHTNSIISVHTCKGKDGKIYLASGSGDTYAKIWTVTLPTESKNEDTVN